MAAWLQNRLKAAEEMLEAVDRTAKTVAVPKWDAHGPPRGPASSSRPAVSQVMPGTVCTYMNAH
jgi:hypothetical protein